jgi:hypothetical protein
MLKEGYPGQRLKCTLAGSYALTNGCIACINVELSVTKEFLQDAIEFV